ncbi:MAG: ABC-type amino acid transport substrate-binding protein, partial [Desulforhopalus sp.]
MKNLATIILTTVFLILGCALPLFAQNPLPKTDALSGQPNQQIILTPGEQAWLLAHPDIQIGYTDTFEPEVIVNPDGSYNGILVDFLDELNRRLGIRITLRIDSIPGILQKAQNKEVDGILEIHPEYADKLGLLKSIGYLRAYPAVFTRKNVSFTGPDDFAGKKIAIIDKVHFSEKIVREYGEQATILRVKDAIQGLKSVSEGAADLYIGVSVNSYYITKYQLFDVVTKYIFRDYPDKFGMAVRPDWPELITIINKGIASFSQNEIDTIVAKWSHLPQQEKTVELTSAETAWLAAHPVIRLGIDAEWAPFIYPNEGKPEGLDIDLINRINELTGANMELITGRWDDLVKQAEKKEIDGLAQSAISEERQKFFHFSETYNSHYYALAISPTQGKTIRNSSDLREKTVSIQRGNLWIRKLTESIEGVQIIEADSQSASFRLVMEGKTDASLIRLSQYPTLRNAFKGNIAIAYVFHENKLDTVYSIRKDWPELVSIINKALSRISEREKNLLLEKWVGRETVELMKAPLNLTQEERAWVREHPVITFGVAEEFPPLNFINKDGEPAGYGIDYAILIARTLGIQYKFVSGSWSDVQ